MYVYWIGSKMKIIQSPNITKIEGASVFLGGSIEMGRAEEWQDRTIDFLQRQKLSFEVTLLNPRRDDWDSSWIQDPTPGTKFHEQVAWELRMQQEATFCVYYFAGDTMSPITLLEFGLFRDKALVYVDPKYQRSGNVIMTCEHYEVPYTSNKMEFQQDILDILIDIHDE